MIDHATQYAKLVTSGKRIASEAERMCCQRHLDDLKKSKEKDYPYKYDAAEAEYHIKVANMLTVSEGETTHKLTTRGFQNFILGNIFGWVEKKDKNKRRFREAYVQMGRQNGKSFLAGVLANDFATFGGYREGRIFCTATKQDQANIVWDEVRKFIFADNELAELYNKPKTYKHEIASKVTGTVIKAIGRDTKTIDGFRSILAIIDEYHLHPTNQMYALMRDGQINVQSPLTIAITTAGFNLNAPCYEQYKLAKNVIKRVVEVPSLFVYIAESETHDERKEPELFKNDLQDKKNWAKANPLIAWKDDTHLDPDGLERIEKEAMTALLKGGQDLVNFETKRLNIWVTNAEETFVDINKWQDGGRDKTIADMKDKSCYVGLDLSEGGDLTSVSFVFPLENGETFVDSHSFIPKYAVVEKEQTDIAPYRQWINQNLLTVTNGPGTYGLKTDYKAIIKYLKDLREQYNITYLGIGYDNRNAAAFLTDLDRELGVDLTEIIQSAKNLNDATQDFRLSVKAGAVEHNSKNTLLTWSIANATMVTNVYNEVKIDKANRNGRIDPCDALIDAWMLHFRQKPAETVDNNEVLDDWLDMF